MDRPSIQRSDFPTVRRGYDPDAVDQHLRRIADDLESGRGGRPVAAAASSRVAQILEAAEATADQLRAEAGEEAREHVHRVGTAARELLERLGAMHDELGAIMDRLREEAGRLSADLRTLERDVAELAPPAIEEEAGYDEPDPEPEPEPVLEVEEPEPETDPERIAAARKKAPPKSAAGKARAKAPKQAAKADDEEAARLVALDMALAGTPREETEKYLAEHYELADPAAVLDDVYALAGS